MLTYYFHAQLKAQWREQFAMRQHQHPSWFVGLIGFSYPEWTTTLYAGHAGTRKSSTHRLGTYATHFNAVEINTTFYGVPSTDAVKTWAHVTPPDFRFSVKMPRDVTHGPTPAGSLAASTPPLGHLLHDETVSTAQRFIDLIQQLGSKLGVVLVQFPPKFASNRRDELTMFLDRLDHAVPLAVELRHDSWWTSETAAMLRDRNVCWVATDESPQHEAEHAPNVSSATSPRPIMPTTDFLYVRWLGKHGQYDDRSKEHFDPSPRLHWWSARLNDMLLRNPRVHTVFGFFDNDFAGHAPATARRFMDIAGLSRPELKKPNEPTLFG